MFEIRHQEVSAKRRKDYYDMKSNLISIEPFDKVWFLNENRKEGCCQKLMSLYTGPYLVLQKLNDINYKIRLNGQGTIQVVNHDKLIPCKSSIIPRWMKLVEQKMSKKNWHTILMIVLLKMYVNKLKLKKKTKIKLWTKCSQIGGRVPHFFYRNFKQINNKSSIVTLILTMIGVQFLLK